MLALRLRVAGRTHATKVGLLGRFDVGR